MIKELLVTLALITSGSQQPQQVSKPTQEFLDYRYAAASGGCPIETEEILGMATPGALPLPNLADAYCGGPGLVNCGPYSFFCLERPRCAKVANSDKKALCDAYNQEIDLLVDLYTQQRDLALQIGSLGLALNCLENGTPVSENNVNEMIANVNAEYSDKYCAAYDAVTEQYGLQMAEVATKFFECCNGQD